MTFQPFRMLRQAAFAFCVVASPVLAADTDAEQAMLEDIANMYLLLLEYQVDPPAGFMVAVNGDASYIATVGTGPDGAPPAEDTIFRIGSISKVLTGQVMAAMIDAGKIGAMDPVTMHLPDMPGTSRDGSAQRLIDLIGQASGLPRELPVDHVPGQSVDMLKTLPSIEAYMAEDPLMFAPGSRILYSNVGFQILGAALGAANGTSYAEALKQYVTGPLGMPDTASSVAPEAMDRLVPSYFFDGSEMPMEEGTDLVGASGGIFTTARDIETWMKWNLAADADPVRDIYHTPHSLRSAYRSVSLMDESGELDAMGMGWVFMDETPYRPYTMQKAGAHAGYMAYVAFVPRKRAGVFMAINKFDFDKDITMTGLANALLADLPGAMD